MGDDAVVIFRSLFKYGALGDGVGAVEKIPHGVIAGISNEGKIAGSHRSHVAAEHCPISPKGLLLSSELSSEVPESVIGVSLP